MIVAKAANMAKMMNIPILGIIENMSLCKVPQMRRRDQNLRRGTHRGDGKGIRNYSSCQDPVDSELSKLSDNGCIELFEGSWLTEAADKLLK